MINDRKQLLLDWEANGRVPPYHWLQMSYAEAMRLFGVQDLADGIASGRFLWNEGSGVIRYGGAADYYFVLAYRAMKQVKK